MIKYIDGKAYLDKISSEARDRFGLIEGKEVPLPLLLYLAYTNSAEIVDEKGEKIMFNDIVKLVKDVNAFSTFLVLYDLSRKGKKVVIGENTSILVIIDDKIKVFVLDEDSYIAAEDLYDIVDRSIKQGYRVVIALVDINGEVTYYEVSKTDFPKIERR